MLQWMAKIRNAFKMGNRGNKILLLLMSLEVILGLVLVSFLVILLRIFLG